jgi:hypothetical protein
MFNAMRRLDLKGPLSNLGWKENSMLALETDDPSTSNFIIMSCSSSLVG